MSDLELTEGWTEPITDQLLLDGVATESLSGSTVECLLWDRTGLQKTSMGTSSILDAATRKVKFVPGAGKLVASESPYFQRWKVTRATGEIYYHPNGPAVRWIVRKP
jgi:hypothetical protein